jgi:UDPglucose 6-dehydrogenase
MNITIIGTGYVGLVTGACFAEMGNTVTCVDIDKQKINNLKKGIIPIYEPGLDEIVINNKNSNRLLFSDSLMTVAKKSNLFFIAVGTPEGSDGDADMRYVYNVAKEIGMYIHKESVIVDKSTVPVGTASEVKSIIRKEIDRRELDLKFHIVSNPEFLKEGDAIRDFMRPDRVVVGSDSEHALNIMKQLYAPFTMNHNRLISMGIKEAELTKYAANSMLATKISFINEIAHICDTLDIDVESVRKGIGADSRIGYSFIYPGAGYGGSCFPKDIKAIIHTAKKVDIDPIVLNAVEERNQRQKGRIFNYIIERFGKYLNGLTFTLWGLSFKPGTDDMREASSLVIIKSLIEAGAIVKAFDPVANSAAEKSLPSEWIKSKKILFLNDSYEALQDSNALILMTEWKMFRNPNLSKMKKIMKNLCIFDGRNQYDPNEIKDNGFEYKGIGRK